MAPTDMALIASAVVQAGRCAAVVYDGVEYECTPDNQEPLSAAILREVQQVEPTTERKGKATEEEVVNLTLPIKASQLAGESVLGKRKDLKTMLSDILAEGVEYFYTTTDIGWHWSLERVNWATLGEGSVGRRVKFALSFVDNSEANELGPGGRKKKAPKKKAAAKK